MKHYCDICGKEKELRFLERFSINRSYKEIICSQSSIHYHQKYNLFRGLLNFVIDEKTFLVCKDCTDNYKRLLRRAENAFSNHDDVKLVSVNYLGHVKVRSAGVKLKTDFFRDISTFLQLLREVRLLSWLVPRNMTVIVKNMMLLL